MASVGLRPEVGTQSSTNFFFSDSRARTLLLAVLLVLIAAVLYAPVHNHPFFNLDDYLDVVDNTHIHHGVDWQTIRWSFVTTNMANWIPLSWLSHALDYQLFGANPAGHHDMNVFFHALDAALLFWVLKRATGYTGRSFMVAALFAVHPMNVEVVAWIAERRSVLCTLFFVLALGTYQWYARNPTDKRYSAVALLFLLGLLAKPQVITLPVFLLLWDYWPLQRMLPHAPSSSPPFEVYPQQTFWQLVKEKLPLLYLCIVDAIFTVYAQASVRPGLMPPLSARLKNAVFSYWLYIKKCFWPAGMAPELPHLGAWLTVWQVLGALAFLLAITALVLVARRYRYLPVGWFWFLGMMVPMIGILQAGRQGMADRFGYQPYIGLFILVCWGVSDWAAKRRISVAWLASASAIILLALAMVTHRQIGYWGGQSHLVGARSSHCSQPLGGRGQYWSSTGRSGASWMRRCPIFIERRCSVPMKVSATCTSVTTSRSRDIWRRPFPDTSTHSTTLISVSEIKPRSTATWPSLTAAWEILPRPTNATPKQSACNPRCRSLNREGIVAQRL